MKYCRHRSDFWITINKNDDSYNISTDDKYVDIINYCFPILERNSPTKWRQSKNYSNMKTLWLPEGRYEQNDIDQFSQWCEGVTKDVVWLSLNKNIKEYFNDELDYCIASDFNIVHGEGRTEIGEAEYQLKYHIGNLNETDREKYTDTIMKKMLDSCKYIPYKDSKLEWCVSPMPATESGKTKLAWKLAEEISKQLSIPFIKPVLNCDKPQMKNISIKEKIEIWQKIYQNDGVILDDQVRGKGVILVDDLYQSGATMWEYAKFLKSLGVECVFGIVCVKSLRDSDNK